jgi:hypothetical protein
VIVGSGYGAGGADGGTVTAERSPAGLVARGSGSGMGPVVSRASLQIPEILQIPEMEPR